MEEKYSNNELGIMLKSLDEKFDTFYNVNNEQHKDLIQHQKKTNGNVMKNTSFRLKFIGAISVISFIGIGNLIGLILLWNKI